MGSARPELMSGEEKTFTGVGASPGIGIGRALCITRGPVKVPFHSLGGPEDVAREVHRFQEGLTATQTDLLAAKEDMGDRLGEYAYIIDAHLSILKDKMIAGRTVELIDERRINAEWALSLAVSEAGMIFRKVKDEYIRSRFTDVEYVAEQVLRHLAGQDISEISQIREKVVVVAHDLSPAETSRMDMGWVLGFATDMGGPTSHTAIMAQAKNIPAVLGLENITRQVKNGDFVVVDGSAGVVVVNPEDEALHTYRERQEAYELYAQEILAQAHLAAETQDGVRVAVGANIELSEEASGVLGYGAEYIGLYRTEFIYISRQCLPTEDELLEDFRGVVERMEGRPVTIRTLDLGADKLAAWQGRPRETNPALGLRAIRLCLREKDLFRTQLRAILRASALGKVRILFPMISGVGELLEAKALLEEARLELAIEGQAHDPNLEVGIMVEIPSAVAVADLLAPHVDFFSIGTNDLIQYAMAIDRVNEHVAHLYQPLHPAVLRMIKQVVQAGHAAGIRVAMCGEMAGDQKAVPLLLGLGLDELSATALAIPRMKRIIRRMNAAQWRELAQEALSHPTAAQVRLFMDHQLAQLYPDIFGPGAQKN
ncbi:MAG: phosphoenolpyruvate--protein phosphotransferase [Deltaproteobacteria bacterium]|nr:phosphoenolpyruvate--protein phosphotransferase [Deltaproteobacteria bacterium]